MSSWERERERERETFDSNDDIGVMITKGSDRWEEGRKEKGGVEKKPQV